MRSGNYVRALGRQSFEPSQPAADGENLPVCEESQARQRELVKAQNDVLATVGVCLRETKQNLDKEDAVLAENEAGLIVGAVDLTVTYLATWPLIGLRNRLQTYRSFEGMRYRDVLGLAWKTQSAARLLTGMPAHLCYQAVNLTKDYLQAKILIWLADRPLFKDPATRWPKNRGWLRALQKILTFGEWFFIFPLYHHSNLQSLHLIPARPLLPPLKSFIPFSSASPLTLPRFSGPLLSWSSATTIATHAATSYFLWTFVHNHLWSRLQLYILRRVLRYLPKPEPGGRVPFIDDEDSIFDQYDQALRSRPDGRTSPVRHHQYHPQHPGIEAIVIEEVGVSAGGQTTLSASVRIDPGATGGGGQGSPSSSRGVLEDQDQELDPLEIDDPPPPPPPPPPTTRSSEPPDPSQIHPHSHSHSHSQTAQRREAYRNTTLSSHPVDVVGSHVADGLATFLMLPMESFVQRLLVRGFLLSRGVSERALDAIVYAPTEVPGNLGLVVRSMVVGEWGLVWMLFEATFALSSFIGIKWFGYLRNV